MGKDIRLEGLRRYQPKDLVSLMGYDNEARFWAMIELAKLEVDAEIGRIPAEIYALLTPEIRERVLDITMTMVDDYERTITRHDVEALVLQIQQALPEALRIYVHHPLTSFDVRDTATSLEFKTAFFQVTQPSARKFLNTLANKAEEFCEETQIGRTHGQHAIPITVGFWLAVFLYRVMLCLVEMRRYANGLKGKISGAVGAYNAQTAFGIYKTAKGRYEDLVLAKIGLEASPISTQILPPEPLANFLHQYVLFSGVLANLGRDIRHLSRTEIREVIEPFGATQTGSSAMPHKRNPITSENSEGMYILIKNLHHNVLDSLVSEHGRDLVGSSVSRAFGGIIVLFQQQLGNWIKEKDGLTFLERLVVNKEALARNMGLSKHVYMSELLWPALAMAGMPGAHNFVNHTLVPKATPEKPLINVLYEEARKNQELFESVQRIPGEILHLMETPENYIGQAAIKTREIVALARTCVGKEC
jgi:adenylosuccinate lyase